VYRSLRILALMASGFWALGVLLILAAFVRSDLPVLEQAGVVLLALGLVQGGSVWLLAFGDAIRMMRWLAILGLLFVAIIFVAVVAFEVSASVGAPDYAAYVVAIILVIQVLPLAVLVYCDMMEDGRPLQWRLFRPSSTLREETRPPVPSAAVGAQELRTLAELRRPAVWDRLHESQRTALLDHYPLAPGPASGGAPLLIDHTQPDEARTEDWLTRYIVERFQPEATSIIRRWLQDGSPNAHLLVVGPAGCGRTSLVASLARRVGATPVVVAALDRVESSIEKALQEADGGVLVVPAADFVAYREDWKTLVTALSTGRCQTPKESTPPPSSQASQHPERTHPCSVRVALVGTDADIKTLDKETSDFYQIFRYQAAFNEFVDWTPKHEAVYAALADGIAQRYQLPPFDLGAVARLVEEGARRLRGVNQSRLMTNLLVLHDLAVEAGRHALARGASATVPLDVEEIITRRRWEYGAPARQVQEAILSNVIIVPTAGAAVGRINGLTVHDEDPGEGSYGKPFRISATVGPGNEEHLIDVEREAEAADKDHVMAALTMIGYLTRQYGKQRPISVAVRIRFEEDFAYRRNEFASRGPSASGAELFALLSALAEVPIYSSLAVTGVVGQYGEIQVIGGVNHKIEGFWEICRKRHLLGEQPQGPYGVLIPAANAHDLMLRPEVAASIAAGQFHVWAIRSIDDGLPILTGMPATEIHQRVARRLQRFYRVAIKGH
jgi:predicted ATP-dependent protease